MTSVPLNPFGIARVLGGVMVPGARGRFGGFAALQTCADVLAARPSVHIDVDFTDSDDEVIRKAFEKLRDGFAVDRFLADPQRTRKFNELCVKLGIKKPPAAVNLRLLRMRKTSGGGHLAPSTRRDVRRGLTERFGAGVEVALIRMLTQFAASVDDILAEPQVGEEFERIARKASPGGTAVEYRLCALQIRKSRHLLNRDATLFDALDARAAEKRIKNAGVVASLAPETLPTTAGILVLDDRDRRLLVHRAADLQATAARIGTPEFLSAMANGSILWHADPATIQLKYILGNSLKLGSLRLWELRLVEYWQPAFNWPVRSAAA